MILLPIPFDGKIKLLVVLEDDNVQRIKEHDCAEIIWAQLGQYAHLRPSSITIAYANSPEMAQIHKWASEGKNAEVIGLLTGGFRFRPEEGDHDFGPISLRKKGD